MKRDVFLGVDGGATKTQVAIVSCEGEFLASIIGGPTPLDAKASRKDVATIAALIEHVCREAGVNRGAIGAAGFGMHGVDYRKELPQQRRTLLGPLGLDPATSILVNDGIVALWGGTWKKRAVVLQLGTGYTAAYRTGYGGETPFDPFNMGLLVHVREDIYKYGYRSYDGREAKSVLPDLVLAHFGVDDMEDLIRLWRRGQLDPWKLLTATSVLVEAVNRNDRVALKLVDAAARSYAHDIRVMLRKIGGETAGVVLGGGALLHGPPLLLDKIEALVKKTYPRVTVGRPMLPPAMGACVMAAHASGADVRAVFRRIRQTAVSA